MKDSNYITLSKLEPRHLKGALNLSQEFSWPYGLEDWEFAASRGEGFVLERGGEVVGTALWWCYGANYATAGMIIVTTKVQGGGQGSRLFNALLEATKDRNVLLNATEEGLPLYQRRGFLPWGKVLRHQGMLTAAPDTELHADIRPANDQDLAAIQTFDQLAIGMPRQELVSALTDVGDTLVIIQDGQFVGYAIARKFGRGYVIGPVAANCAADAKRLIVAHLGNLAGQFVRIDVYAQEGLSDWLQSSGLQLVGEAVSMVRGSAPEPVSPARMYAVANQSFC
ncbi:MULTISPECIES: GNAT family N-acetyltransferase [Neorhizobium]|uniref:GNAT family N-acetyltransferase n=1 Tax=Neorhizobium TaxID=1525371 RepID=UPI000CF90472|nr:MULTISPECIES: GNAT family N-acetyltransferase [Neorhizobium]